MYREINSIFDKKDKLIIVVSIVFSLVVSITEVFGISMLFPFMSVISDANVIQKNKYLTFFYTHIANSEYKRFILIFGIGMIAIFIIKNIITILFNYYTISVAKKLNRKYANKLFKTYLDFEYINYIQKNRIEFTRMLTYEVSLLVTIFQNMISLVSESFIMLLLYVIMLCVNWKLTLAMTIFLLLNILVIKYIVIGASKKMGKGREARSQKLYKLSNSVFSNYKFVKLQGNHKDLKKEYNHLMEINDEIVVKQGVLTPLPKSILEFAGFFMIVVIVLYAVVQGGEEGVKNILPIISLFFLSLYRMLPSIIRIVGIFQGMAFFAPVPKRIMEELNYKVENLGEKKLEFRDKIELKNIKFQYREDEITLNNISLEIKKGESVAFIGESGSGKTTLVDIIMGLYKPFSGNIVVDGEMVTEENLKSWRRKVGYIPQEIYLFDGTVGENVAFGNEYDEKRVIEVLKQAKIWEFLKEKQGVDTRVGDAGIMLSGGQKQRIGIARALYKNQEILVLDEATSALDDKTEKEIMDEIYGIAEGRTLIMIAHRLTSLKKCNKIYQFEKGRLIGEYSNIDEVRK